MRTMTDQGQKVTVLDVAAYILKKKGEMSAWKLQKLVYYSLAWSLVWDDRPLFTDRIEAWANGPVCPRLFYAHQGKFLVDFVPEGDPEKLNADARETVDAVLEFYGDWTSQELSDLSHTERPWKDARGNLPPSVRGNEEITHLAMAEYYTSIPPPAQHAT